MASFPKVLEGPDVVMVKCRRVQKPTSLFDLPSAYIGCVQVQIYAIQGLGPSGLAAPLLAEHFDAACGMRQCEISFMVGLLSALKLHQSVIPVPTSLPNFLVFDRSVVRVHGPLVFGGRKNSRPLLQLYLPGV